MKKLLSVLIPVYNQQDLIIRALLSIPKRDDIEIIVCDDGSCDDTVKRIEQYLPNDDRVILLKNETNQGVAVAENKCLDIATGEYLVRLDSDDYFYPLEFEKLLKEIDGTDLIYFNLRWNTGRVLELTPKNKHIFVGAVKLVRRKFVEDIRNIPDKRTGEDWFFYQEIAKRKPIEKFTNIIAKHYNHPREGSLSAGGEGSFEHNIVEDTKKPLDILFYIGDIYKIGGIETWAYYVIKDLVAEGKNIRVAYKTGDPKQIARLKTICPVERIDVAKKTCDILFHCYCYEYPDVISDISVQIIHANYGELSGIKFKRDSDKYISVSETAKECCISVGVNDIKIDVIENYIPKLEYIKKKEKRDYIKIISATRLSNEKGYSKMLEFAKLLKKEGINYKWYVYTTDVTQIDNKLFIKMSPELDIINEIADADYLAQFSSTEAYCYAVHEALAVSTPILINEWNGNPLTDKNGYSYKQIMKNPHIIKKIPKGFTHEQKSSVQDWLDYIEKLELDVAEKNKNKVWVKSLYNFYATKEKKHLKKGQNYKLTYERAEELSGSKNNAKKPLVVKLNNL